MSDNSDYIDIEEVEILGDISEATKLLENNNKKSSKRSFENVSGVPAHQYIQTARQETSHDDQAETLITTINAGIQNQDDLRKKISEVLKKGDPIIEGRSVMVVLARKEMDKMMRAISAMDKIESIIFDKIEQGHYDQRPDYELKEMVGFLSNIVSRNNTLIRTVLDNPAYEEFMLAYRDCSDIKVNNLASVANRKESRQKLRDIVSVLREELSANNKGKRDDNSSDR